MTYRITIELTAEERRQLRMDAALLDITVSKLAKRRVTRRCEDAKDAEVVASMETPRKEPY